MNIKFNLLFLLIGAVLSWHPTGHFIIVRIAEIELEAKKPELLKKLIELLKYKPLSAKEKNHVFVESACFPDDIKYIGWKAFNQFHFYDNFIRGDNTTPEQIAKLGKSIVNMANSVGDARETLRNTKSSMVDDRFAKGFELRYLLHLIGDIHQPMHSGSRVVNGKPDAGGNAVTLPSPWINLHNMWDKTLGHFKDLKAPLEDKHWGMLNEYCKNLMAANGRDKFVKEFEKKTAGTWITEAHQLEKEYAYKDITQDKPVPQAYIDRAKPVIEKQLVLGGYRLTNYLIDTFEGMDLEVVFGNHVKNSSPDSEEDLVDDPKKTNSDGESDINDPLIQSTTFKDKEKVPAKGKKGKNAPEEKIKGDGLGVLKDDGKVTDTKTKPKAKLLDKKKAAPKRKGKFADEDEWSSDDDEEELDDDYYQQNEEDIPNDNLEQEGQHEDDCGFFCKIGRFFVNIKRGIFG